MAGGGSAPIGPKRELLAMLKLYNGYGMKSGFRRKRTMELYSTKFQHKISTFFLYYGIFQLIELTIILRYLALK